MEMMAELDCDDTNIYDAQTRIAKKQQTQNLLEAKLKNKGKEDAIKKEQAENLKAKKGK